MESKGEAKREVTRKGEGKGDEEAEDIEEISLHEQEKAQKKNLIMKFSEFAFRVLNHDMDDFFEDNMGAFDQEEDELLSGAGETLEQYSVYEEYLQELEKRFDGFAVEEGFDSAMDCFNALNDLVIEDRLEREQAMKELANKMKEMQEMWQKKLMHKSSGNVDDKAEGKNDEDDAKNGSGGGDAKGRHDDDDAKADAKHSSDQENDDPGSEMQNKAPPVVMFFQPISMDAMLKHVLSLTEYTTFSIVMRAKVRQAKLLRIMERKVDRQEDDQAVREDVLRDGSIRKLTDVFEELVERICGLTPHQKELQREIQGQLKVEDWEDMLSSADDDLFPDKYKQVFKRLVMTTCMAIWNMVSLQSQQKVRLELCRFLPQIDQLSNRDEVFDSAVGFLKMSHCFVDDTEQNMVEVLRAHSKHHHHRKAGMSDLEAK